MGATNLCAFTHKIDYNFSKLNPKSRATRILVVWYGQRLESVQKNSFNSNNLKLPVNLFKFNVPCRNINQPDWSKKLIKTILIKNIYV